MTARGEDASGSLESIEDAAFGGPAGDVINARWTSLAWQFRLAAGARVISRLRGYEGVSCSECQNFTMVRNGTCLKCDTCGSTTGCS